MLALKDIMTRDVLTLSPEHSLRDAMELLTARHVSGAPVISRGRVVGVVSLTDLAELATTVPGVPPVHPGRAWNGLEDTTVQEAMTMAVASLPAATPVEDAASFMQLRAIHRVLVMEGDRLVGVVSTKDIADAVADQRLTKRVFVFERGNSTRW